VCHYPNSPGCIFKDAIISTTSTLMRRFMGFRHLGLLL
jgi:hypothetical protein